MDQDTKIGIAIILGVNVLTSIIKRWVYPKYGKVGVQILVFILAAIGALYFMYSQLIPGLQEFVASFISIVALSMTFYEVILSHIPLFKGHGDEESE